MEKCLYTITTDSQPIIDHYGPGLVLGCGFSGSGFKNSPAWGKMLACLALGKEAEIPEGFQLNNYRLNRCNKLRDRRREICIVGGQHFSCLAW